MLVPGATLILLNHLDQPSRTAEPYRVTEAEYTLAATATPPQQTEWRTVEVPNRVPAEMSPFVSAWYRVPLTVPARAGDEPWALYLTSPSANVAAFVDDIAIGSTGRPALPLVFVTEPLFYPFDLRLLGTDRPHYLYLRITRTSSTAGVAPFYIGPAPVLRSHFENERFFSEQVPGALVAVMATVSLLTLVLFVLHFEEKAYGWYGLAIGLWALHTGHGLINVIPIPHYLWFSLVYLTLWWVLIFVVFTNRFFGLPWRRVEPVLWALGGILTVVGLGVGISGNEALYRGYFSLAWVPYVVFWGLFVVAQLVYASLRKPDFESLGMLLTAVTSLVVGMRDALVELGRPEGSGGSYFTQYTAAFSVLMVMFLLARRFIRYQKESASVGQRLAEERARITRDMHDGLGGQLMHALSLSERGGNEREIREALSTALQDLRLIIDSFTPSDADLLGVLAGFRHRTAKLLRKQGIETAWRVEDVDDHPLTPQQALHLLRILQEAVTNVVRHARARCITLGVRQNAGRVMIDIEDDGIGMGGAEPGTGLGNMQERARLMGSTVEIGSGGTGTRVRITLG